jgi:crossover junction endodeoxyribonuclease RuvC
MNHYKILAIDPGTRYMGVAFIDNGRLIYHGVKVLKKGNSPHENLFSVRKIVLRLIKDFQPHLIAVEKAFFGNNRKAALVNVVVMEMRAIARRKQLKFVDYSPSTLKKFITGNGRASKMEVSRAVVLKYPELKVFLTQDRAWKERFHQNMFDAVALGIMAGSKGYRG